MCDALSSFSHPHLQIAKTLNEQISKYCQVVLDSLAYAGTGDVLKVQELLAMCGEHIETEETTAWKVTQSFFVFDIYCIILSPYVLDNLWEMGFAYLVAGK